jgi:hypothetical protein
MHQADLECYVRTLPASTLAALARDGREFSAARTPVPSDSFPGLVAQVTGGNPATTGIYYDDSYDREPHSYLKVNTIFEVTRGAGLRTARADKHPAYEMLNGPSGTGVQDLFTPEINGDAPTLGAAIDWTKDNASTQRYDAYKVHAVVNEIHGLDRSGATAVGTPAIFVGSPTARSSMRSTAPGGGAPRRATARHARNRR